MRSDSGPGNHLRAGPKNGDAVLCVVGPFWLETTEPEAFKLGKIDSAVVVVIEFKENGLHRALRHVRSHLPKGVFDISQREEFSC